MVGVSEDERSGRPVLRRDQNRRDRPYPVFITAPAQLSYGSDRP